MGAGRWEAFEEEELVHGSITLHSKLHFNSSNVQSNRDLISLTLNIVQSLPGIFYF